MLTYNSAAFSNRQAIANSFAPVAVGYPGGYNLTAITGTRTVYTASAAAPTIYRLNSTTTISLVPYLNFGFGFGLAPVASNTAFSALYDNIAYVNNSVPDRLDGAGWLIALSAAQPGSFPITGYPNVITLYQNNTLPTSNNQLSTIGSFINAQGGINGAFTQFAASAVLGDPQFSGLLGQSFQVHGVAGAVYNLISDRGMVVNSRFVFLSSGACPPASASTTSPCWSHPGSYLGELAVVTADGDVVVVISGSAVDGFASVTVNDREVTVGTDAEVAGATTVVLDSRHSVHISAGNWRLHVENSDHFVNMVQLAPVQWSQVHHSRGLIGQTHTRPRVPGAQVKEISGRVDDYVEQEGQLTGSKFGYADE